MPSEYRKKIITLGAICLALFGLTLSLSFLGQRRTTREEAFGSGATLKLTTETATHAVGEEFWVEAKIDTQEKITMYRLNIAYDKTKIAIVPVGAGRFESGPKFGFINSFVDDGNGNLMLRSGYMVPTSGQRDPNDLPTGNNVLLARFKVKGLVEGTTQLSFLESSIVNGYNPGLEDVVVNIATRTPLNLTFGPGEEAMGQVNVRLEPSTANKAVNQEFDVDIKVEAGNYKIILMALRLDFDKNKLQLVKFTPDSAAWTPDLSDGVDDDGNPVVDLGNETGTARLFAAKISTDLKSGNFTAGKLTLKGKTVGIAALTIKKEATASMFGGETTDGRQGTLVIGQTTDGSYTFGGTGTGVVINFKAKFQGISAKRVDQKVKVTVKKGSFSEAVEQVTVSADDNGVYSGSATFNSVTPGGGYAIFVKGPKHLAKKFCTNNQETRCAGSGSLTLVTGQNTFDFSKVNLEAGDLPNPNESNRQDGVVNSVDVSLLEARVAKSDESSLTIADLDLDGIVNWKDMGLLINTLETKYEEDY